MKIMSKLTNVICVQPFFVLKIEAIKNNLTTKQKRKRYD